MNVNIHETKTNLSKLLQLVAAGEDVVICRAGTPIARLVPYEEKAAPQRVLGTLAGKVWIADDWDEPDEECIEAFYNSRIFPDE